MLKIQNVRPAPIPDYLVGESEIWGITQTFEKGKNYLVTAPSGKGKSTFLHLFYGLRTDYEGDLFINDQNIKQYNLKDWATLRQRRLSIVFQDLRLFLPLTGLENIQLKNALTNSVSDETIQKMAKRLGIASILGQTCATMSYGQRQRVAIIRALVQPFDFLLLDEPFSHLDTANARFACDLIADVATAQQASILLVSLGESYFLDYHAQFTL